MKPEDDEFHAHNADDWWAVETLWFAFSVPEKKLSAVVYLVTRLTAGVTTLFITMFDDSGYEPWKTRYNRALWSLPIPASLRKFDMPAVGLSFETLEPTRRYRMHYEHAPYVSFDLDFAGIIEPQMFPGKYAGMHIDQPVRVTGTLTLDGETMAVDCLQMRDRSWGSTRSDLDERRGAYTYAIASEKSAFHLISTGTPGVNLQMRSGFLVRDGIAAHLRSATREVLKRGDLGQPQIIRLTGIDERDRSFEAVGTVASFQYIPVPGNIFGMGCLTSWEFDGQTCWGEEQESWSPIGLSRSLRGVDGG